MAVKILYDGSKPQKDCMYKCKCENCKSIFEFEAEDEYIGALGIAYVKCPVCGDEIIYDDGIVLTRENVKFPQHYFRFGGDDCVMLSNKETDRYVRECIDALRNSDDKNFYATHTGTGDTHVFVFRYDGDEEYFVYVGKNGYETNVPFTEDDY